MKKPDASNGSDSGALASSLQIMSLEDLPIGVTVQFPLREIGGALILDEGKPITPDLLLDLQARGVESVWIHQTDLDGVGDPSSEAIVPRDVGSALLDIHNSATRRLDHLLRQPASLDVPSSGRPFHDQFRRRGLTPYDDRVLDAAHRTGRESADALGNLLSDLLDVGRAGDNRITAGKSIVDAYMSLMKVDIDLVLATATRMQEVDYLIGHSLQLAVLGMAMAADMAVDEYGVAYVGLCGLLQEVGMLKAPRELLEAADPLQPYEFVEIMKHVLYTAELLESAGTIPNVVRLAAYQMHERFDGSGYPRGISGAKIHPFARILGVADAYLALVSPRPFREPLRPYAAMEAILRLTGQGQFDPRAIRSLLHVLSLFPVGSGVLLNDGSAGKVLRTNQIDYRRPMVEIALDRSGATPATPILVDLAHHSKLDVVRAIHLS